MRTKKAVAVVVLAVSVVCLSIRPAHAFFGSSAGLLSMIDSNTAISSVANTMSKLQAIEQTIIQTQQMIYEIESLKYMFANANSFAGILQDTASIGSMAAGLAAGGIEAYQGLASAYNLPALSPADYNGYLGAAAQGSNLLGSLSMSAGQISSLGQVANGMTGTALLNGASTITQAALTTTGAVMNLQSYLAQKDAMKRQEAMIKKVAFQQKLASNSIQYATVPCLNRSATVTVLVQAQSSSQGVMCTRTQIPRPLIVTNPVSSGINAQLRNAYEMQCAAAAQQNLGATLSGAGAATEATAQAQQQLNRACGQATPPVYAPAPGPAPATPAPPEPPPIPELGTFTGGN